MMIISITIFFLLLGCYIYLSGPKKWWVVIFYIPMVLFLLGSTLELVGRGKPVNLEIRQLWINESKIISYYLVENTAIYLWLLVEGEPRYYVLPWDMKKAKQLHNTSKEKGGSGKATFRWPYLKTDSESLPDIYETPQLPSPLKL